MMIAMIAAMTMMFMCLCGLREHRGGSERNSKSRQLHYH
jgi:hypothetical protein